MALAVIFGVMGNAFAEEYSIKDVKKKAIEAAEYLSRHGEEALKEFNDPGSRWSKEPYAFIDDLNGNIIAHPKSILVGKNLLIMKDIKGKMFAAEFLKVAKSEKGAGWVDYWWPEKKGREPKQKVTYIVRVSGKNMFVGIGIYGFDKKQAIAEAGE